MDVQNVKFSTEEKRMMIVMNMQNNSNLTETPANRPLREYVKSTLLQYFDQLEGQNVVDLYQLVLGEVEAPLMETVMAHTRGNQSKAAVLLGVSRSTLRKKLKQYQLNRD